MRCFFFQPKVILNLKIRFYLGLFFYSTGDKHKQHFKVNSPTSYLPHNLTLGLISWCYTSKLSPAVGYLSLNSRMNLKFFDTVRRIKLFEIPRGEYDQK